MEHRTSLRLPDELYERLRRLSFATRRSQQVILLEALAAYLAQEDQRAPAP